MSVTAKGYQKEAVKNALEIFRYVESQLQQADDEQSRRTISAFNGCVLLEAPTGAGKTLMAGMVAETFSRNDHHHNAKIIWFWFTPFANLVEQAKIALKKDFAGLAIRDLSNERVAYKAVSGDVFVTTWASVAAQNTQTRKLRTSGDTSLALDEFIPELRAMGYRIGVVIDEAHHSFVKAGEAVKFYRDIMSPEFSLLITATPDDEDVKKFKKAAGLAEIHNIQVSRKDAVKAGLIKQAVKSIAYLVGDKQKQSVDLELTALADGWKTHQAIKTELASSKINLTPLMLVQVDSKGKAGAEVIEKTKQRLMEMGVAEEAIAWYTADDPNDDLIAVALDETKEVLIFKVAVALGFDAPRAYTLVSLRGTKSTDFGIQVVGRILRVHKRLQAMAQSDTLPELLRFGYVFLADSESQGGLISAAEKINAIQTQLSSISPNTIIFKVADETQVQVSQNGQISLLPNPYIAPAWEETTQPEHKDTSIKPSVSGENHSLWENLLAPKPAECAEPKNRPDYVVSLSGNRFALRDNVATHFKSERMPLGTDELLKSFAVHLKLDAEVLNAGLRKNTKISKLTINIFDQTDRLLESIQARLSDAEIARRAQRVLFEAEFIDVRDLHAILLNKLRAEYNEHQGMELSDKELIKALNTILATYPKLIRNALKSCMAQFKEIYAVAELPQQITAFAAVERASLNVYGIIPEDLNETERKFAKLLETDTSQIINWWHRNEPRKPYSVGIVLPDGDRYFPDFIIHINRRNRNEGMLLVEIKGEHILNSDDTLDKITAEHKIYGKPIMLSLQDNQFWIMRYIESSNRIEKDRAFRIEDMGEY